MDTHYPDNALVINGQTYVPWADVAALVADGEEYRSRVREACVTRARSDLLTNSLNLDDYDSVRSLELGQATLELVRTLVRSGAISVTKRVEDNLALTTYRLKVVMPREEPKR